MVSLYSDASRLHHWTSRRLAAITSRANYSTSESQGRSDHEPEKEAGSTSPAFGEGRHYRGTITDAAGRSRPSLGPSTSRGHQGASTAADAPKLRERGLPHFFKPHYIIMTSVAISVTCIDIRFAFAFYFAFNILLSFIITRLPQKFLWDSISFC